MDELGAAVGGLITGGFLYVHPAACVCVPVCVCVCVCIDHSLKRMVMLSRTEQLVES